MRKPPVSVGETITIYGLEDAHTYAGKLQREVNPLYWTALVNGETWIVSWSTTESRWEGGKAQ